MILVNSHKGYTFGFVICVFPLKSQGTFWGEWGYWKLVFLKKSMRIQRTFKELGFSENNLFGKVMDIITYVNLHVNGSVPLALQGFLQCPVVYNTAISSNTYYIILFLCKSWIKPNIMNQSTWLLTRSLSFRQKAEVVINVQAKVKWIRAKYDF